MVIEVDIAPPDYRDPVKMLRNIADEIEAGVRYGRRKDKAEATKLRESIRCL